MTQGRDDMTDLTVSEWEACFAEMAHEYLETRAESLRARLHALWRIMPWQDMKYQQQCLWARAKHFWLKERENS